MTGAASLVVECGTNILFKKREKKWLLVLKNGNKNDSSLINDRVIDV